MPSKFASDEKPTCTCEHDQSAQTATLDPACPIHGNGAEIVATSDGEPIEPGSQDGDTDEDDGPVEDSSGEYDGESVAEESADNPASVEE